MQLICYTWNCVVKYNVGTYIVHKLHVANSMYLVRTYVALNNDIVLEISFLDINDCPNLSRSNWKLWKEMLITQKGVIRYQIFLHVVDGHEKTDFFC